MDPVSSSRGNSNPIPAVTPATAWDKVRALFANIFCAPEPPHPYLALPVTRASVVWDNVRVILAKMPLQQADLDEITALEETLISTHQHYQNITFVLANKAKDEGNPVYYDYAIQMASKSGFRDKQLYINWVRKQASTETEKIKVP